MKEKNREIRVRRGVTETGAENDAGTEVAVKIELNMCEIEVEAKRES